MNLEELKERLRNIEPSNIKVTFHAGRRIQDKRRNINYRQINRLMIISAHKVKRRIQRQIEHENKH